MSSANLKWCKCTPSISKSLSFQAMLNSLGEILSPRRTTLSSLMLTIIINDGNQSITASSTAIRNVEGLLTNAKCKPYSVQNSSPMQADTRHLDILKHVIV